MAIQGLRTTTNFAADVRPKSYREGVLRLDPNGNVPITALTSMMKSRKVDDPEFNWWDKVSQTRRVALHATNGDLTTSNTTLILDATGGAKGYKEGDILYIEQTKERVRVASNPVSDTVLTVERGFGSTTITAVDANGAGINPNLVCIGSVYEEGSLPPIGVTWDPNKKYNYTQIFRNTFEATRTAMKTRLRTGDDIKEAKRECLFTHTQDMERAFLLGTRSEGIINGKPARSTGGLMYFIENYSGNVFDAKADYASGVTMAGWEEYMYRMFRYGSQEKMVFAGNRALLALQQLIRKNGHYEWKSGDKEYGMNVSKLFSPFGTLIIKNHPILNQLPGGTTTGTAYYGMDSWMFGVDMANLTYAYIDDTKYEPKLEANGLDGMQSGYLTECGLEIAHPSTFFLMKNLVAGAADA